MTKRIIPLLYEGEMSNGWYRLYVISLITMQSSIITNESSVNGSQPTCQLTGISPLRFRNILTPLMMPNIERIRLIKVILMKERILLFLTITDITSESTRVILIYFSPSLYSLDVIFTVVIYLFITLSLHLFTYLSIYFNQCCEFSAIDHERKTIWFPTNRDY